MQEHPWVSRSLPSKYYYLAGAFPQNTIFELIPGTSPGREPGECGQTCLCRGRNFPRGRLAWSWGAGGVPGSGTEALCACQRRERAVIHRLPER